MGELSTCQFLLAVLVLNGICYGQECDLNDVSCINCTGYQKCAEGAPIGPIFSCKNGVDCREEPLLKHCWTKLNCYVLNECTEVGIFPDQTTESKYFICLPDSGSGFLKYDFTCPEGKYFDKTSRMCVSIAVTPETTSESTTNSSSLAPTKETTTTVPASSETPETTSSNSTPTPTTENTVTFSTSRPTAPPFFACTVPGIFPNPSNCKMYFRCSTSLKVYNYTCPGASYFNEDLLKCSLIITPTCQEEILKNLTTSTTSMTITSTTKTSISTAPSLLRTFTATTSQAPSTPFSCSAAGTFENPLGCTTYYRCTSTGRIFLYDCPPGSYYNEFTKRCSLTITPRCRNKLDGYFSV